MNDDFENNVPKEDEDSVFEDAFYKEITSEDVPEASDPTTAETIDSESSSDAEIEDAVFEPVQDAQTEEPFATSMHQPAEPQQPHRLFEPPVNPVYQQNYAGYQSGSYNNQYSSQPGYNGASQPGYNGYQPYQSYQPAPQPKKKNKGVKIFACILAFVIVFSLGAGVSSLLKAKKTTNSNVNQNTYEPLEGATTLADSQNAPDLNINASPESPTNVDVKGALTTSQVAAKVKPSIVGIVVYTNRSNSSAAGEGTGVIMGEDETGEYTYIITCAHVISEAGIKVRIQLEDGTTFDAEIVGFDTRTDLGVLKIKAKGLKAAEFGDSDALKVGDSVYAIGNPGGVEFFGSFTGGFVSAIDRPVSSEIGYTMKCIQHDAAINPGNSGGALVNAYGQVIGINSQKIAATNYEGMGFAIPITSAKPIIQYLINYGYVPNRPKLGITYYSVGASAQYSMIAQINGLPSGTLIINDISSDSSLANSDARQYDMIIAVDGKQLDSADVLLEKIDKGKVGDKMKLTLVRVNGDYSISKFDVEAVLVEDKSGSEAETQTSVYYVDPFNFYFNNGR